MYDIIKVSEDFKKNPWGEDDARIFRDMILIPKLVNCDRGEKVTIDFDDCYGVSWVFLGEVFGGLISEYGFKKKNILKKIHIISRDDELIHELIIRYLDRAEEQLKR